MQIAKQAKETLRIEQPGRAVFLAHPSYINYTIKIEQETLPSLLFCQTP
jgi:hypothetical protein